MGGAWGKSSHSLPPTANQQRYLCHCESPHLWSVISCCSWLISCRAAGKAAVPLSQAAHELILSRAAPRFPRLLEGSRAENTVLPRAFSFLRLLHAQTWALLSAKLVGLKERNMHETMCLGLLCKGGSPVQMLFPLILFSGKKEEPIRLFSKL